MVHDALLDRTSFRFSITTDYRKLWEVPAQEMIHVAVLHDTLSSFELEAACRLIRQRWPDAKILLIAKGESFLDDGLYDDRAPTTARDVLLGTIERLAGGSHDWPQVKFRTLGRMRKHEDSFVPGGSGLRRARRRCYAESHDRH
jgi:hypothetical protein